MLIEEKLELLRAQEHKALATSTFETQMFGGIRENVQDNRVRRILACALAMNAIRQSGGIVPHYLRKQFWWKRFSKDWFADDVHSEPPAGPSSPIISVPDPLALHITTHLRASFDPCGASFPNGFVPWPLPSGEPSKTLTP